VKGRWWGLMITDEYYENDIDNETDRKMKGKG
jgi:hypothetical protein